MRFMRALCRDRLYAPRRDRLVRKTGDSVIIATLLLLIAMAILTAPRSGAEAYRKLHALLLVDAAPEWIATAGAIGEHFPVSP